MTAFYSDYSRLRTLEPQPAGAVYANLGKGSVRGVERWVSERALLLKLSKRF